MLASLSKPLLLLILTLSQQPTSAQALPQLPGIANQQPLQQQPQPQPQEPLIPSLGSLSHTDLEKITMHTTLTLYTATQTITVPNTREAMQTSLSSFAEDAEEEVELDPAALLELVRKARGDENWTPQMGDDDLVDWGDSDQET